MAGGNRASIAMPKDLEGLSVAELDALIATAQAVRDDTRERRRQELKAGIEATLKAEGFTAIEVLGAKVRPKPQPLPARYADPDDPSLTWSGKGRMPGWLQVRIDTGVALEQFRIT